MKALFNILEGHFQLEQVFPATISSLNIWDYEMSASQLSALDCNSTGNLVDWDLLKVHGKEKMHYQMVPCKGEKLTQTFNLHFFLI